MTELTPEQQKLLDAWLDAHTAHSQTLLALYEAASACDEAGFVPTHYLPT
jgi:hypothetical protein